MIFEPIGVNPVAHGENALHGRDILQHRSTASRCHNQYIIMMNIPFAVHHKLLVPVNPFNTYPTVQPDVIIILFLVRHLNKISPAQHATDISRQHYPVVEREIFFTEYLNLVICIEGPVTFYKSKGPCAGTYDNYFLFWLFV